MKIIVLEDEALLSMCIVDMLEGRGHEVTPLFGVEQLRLGTIIGITSDYEDVEVNLADYAMAIVDGSLVGHLTGWEIVPTLLAAGLTCIAHSSEMTSNFKMREAGAQYHSEKGIRALKVVLAEFERSLTS